MPRLAVVGPTLNGRERQQIGIIRADNLLTHSLLDNLRGKAHEFGQLGELLEEDKHKVGIHQIIDPEALRLLKRNRIETIVVNGFKPENLVAAIKGEKIGTRIQ